MRYKQIQIWIQWIWVRNLWFVFLPCDPSSSMEIITSWSALFGSLSLLSTNLHWATWRRQLENIWPTFISIDNWIIEKWTRRLSDDESARWTRLNDCSQKEMCHCAAGNTWNQFITTSVSWDKEFQQYGNDTLYFTCKAAPVTAEETNESFAL